jgi:hypothetical protein
MLFFLLRGNGFFDTRATYGVRGYSSSAPPSQRLPAGMSVPRSLAIDNAVPPPPCQCVVDWPCMVAAVSAAPLVKTRGILQYLTCRPSPVEELARIRLAPVFEINPAGAGAMSSDNKYPRRQVTRQFPHKHHTGKRWAFCPGSRRHGRYPA